MTVVSRFASDIAYPKYADMDNEYSVFSNDFSKVNRYTIFNLFKTFKLQLHIHAPTLMSCSYMVSNVHAHLCAIVSNEQILIPMLSTNNSTNQGCAFPRDQSNDVLKCGRRAEPKDPLYLKIYILIFFITRKIFERRPTVGTIFNHFRYPAVDYNATDHNSQLEPKRRRKEDSTSISTLYSIKSKYSTHKLI